ncbi:MAG: 50S ribosomal protein L3 [Candidatus Kapaibacterium sp.]
MAALLGRKIGMTGIFNEQGVYIPCTLIETGPCTVVQVRTMENDGYEALQLGFGSKKEKNINKPETGHLQKAGVSGIRDLREFRSYDVSNYKLGDTIGITDIFAIGDKVRVTTDSKGHGFQGVMKRHHFGGVGMQTHGQSDRQRAPGSIGGSSYPSRVFPGTRMAGRMGGKKITVRNLQVVGILADKNVLIVKGSIPGAPNCIVEILKQPKR